MEEINDRAISKGHVDNEISKRLKRSPDNSSRSSIGRELSKELSTDKTKSEDNESGISGEDATDGRRRLESSENDADEIRYSYKARDPKTVTEKEFKHHYWAVANNLLSKEELGVLNSAIGNISRGEVYEKNADGFYMIPVGENGVLNKIVFTDGKHNAYSIDAVIIINLNNETDLSIERSIVYASERKGIYTETNGLVEVHYAKDFKFSEFQRKLTQNPQNSNGKQNGTRSGRKVKFSLKDSDGNELSPEQQGYFKNSKVVDKDGNLLVVYHGSPSKFTEFSHSFMNTNGNAHGKGFYFTEDVEYADGFKKDGGQLLKGYLNIQKPISETDVTISKTNLVKLIKATCEAQAKEFIDEESYDNIEDALLDTWVSNYVDTYSAYSMDYVYRSVADSVLNNCENDVDILAELVNGGAGTSRVLTLARKTIGNT